jgi:hypothetical protein
MTLPDDSSHIMPRDEELPSRADSAPDWREFTRDELQHERFCYDYGKE